MVRRIPGLAKSAWQSAGRTTCRFIASISMTRAFSSGVLPPWTCVKYGVPSMQHIEYEGRCFVLSACQQPVSSDWEEDLQDAGGVINGGSLIVSPGGAVIAGPLSGAGLPYAEIDLKEVIRGKFDLDVAGHYSRLDIFDLRVSGRSDTQPSCSTLCKSIVVVYYLHTTYSYSFDPGICEQKACIPTTSRRPPSP